MKPKWEVRLLVLLAVASIGSPVSLAVAQVPTGEMVTRVAGQATAQGPTTDEKPVIVVAPSTSPLQTSPAQAVPVEGANSSQMTTPAGVQHPGALCSQDVRMFDGSEFPQGGYWWWSDGANPVVGDNQGQDIPHLSVSGQMANWMQWIVSASDNRVTGLPVPGGYEQRGTLSVLVKVETEETSTINAYDRAWFRWRDTDTGGGVPGGGGVEVNNLDAWKGWFLVTINPYQSHQPYYEAHHLALEFFFQEDATYRTTWNIGPMWMNVCGPTSNVGLSLYHIDTDFWLDQLRTTKGRQGCDLLVDGTPYHGLVKAGSNLMCVGRHCTMPFNNSQQAALSSQVMTRIDEDYPPNNGPATQCAAAAETVSTTARPEGSYRSYLPLVATGKNESTQPELVVVDIPEWEIPWWASHKIELWDLPEWGQVGLTAAAVPSYGDDEDWGLWGIIKGAAKALIIVSTNTEGFRRLARWQALVRWVAKVTSYPHGIWYEGRLWNSPWGRGIFVNVAARPSPAWPAIFVPTFPELVPGGITVGMFAYNTDLRQWLGPYIWARAIKDQYYEVELQAALEMEEAFARGEMDIQMSPAPAMAYQHLMGKAFAQQWSEAAAAIGEALRLEESYYLMYDFSIVAGSYEVLTFWWTAALAF